MSILRDGEAEIGARLQEQTRHLRDMEHVWKNTESDVMRLQSFQNFCSPTLLKHNA